MSLRVVIGTGLLALSAIARPVAAAPMVVDEYIADVGGVAYPEKGQSLWVTQTGKGRSCASCHGADPVKSGKHERTGKRIGPMAPSVDPQRFTDAKKVAKWFKRNCKWTLGRECTPQEKANVLAWLNTL